MRREPPVRIREGLGVKFPRATRLVMGSTCEEDARRVMEVLPKRFEKYGLTIHPDKTRLVPFERPGSNRDGASSESTAWGGWNRTRRDFSGWTVRPYLLIRLGKTSMIRRASSSRATPITSRVARGSFTPRPSRIRTGGSRLIRLL